MISKFLIALEKGVLVMRSNSRMLLVAVLVFVFPVLFAWLTHNFFSTATANIETIQKQKIALIHDTLSLLVSNNEFDTPLVESLVDEYKQQNLDISKVRIVTLENDKFLITFDSDQALIGTYEESDELYRNLPQSASSNAFIFKLSVNGNSVWQVLSKASVNNSDFYIFTEHNFAFIDKVMSSRKQQSYYGLTAIFLFLIGLAYWLNRQIYWQAKYTDLSKQLKERDMFSNMIAHEFRTPLTIIKGYASFMKESDKLSDEDARYVKNIYSATERLVQLVNDFLEVARLQSGKIKISKSREDINLIIFQVCEDMQTLAHKKNIKLTAIKSTKSVFLNTDTKRMTQILINIITNAIKYTNEGSVTVECQTEAGKVTILVSDTGTGISADDQEKLFTPFSRVGDVDSSDITGSGLGMWITKQLVALLKGKIGVESIKGVGTHMVITFDTYDE